MLVYQRVSIWIPKKNGISPVAPVSVAQGSASKASLEVGAVVAREADLG